MLKVVSCARQATPGHVKVASVIGQRKGSSPGLLSALSYPRVQDTSDVMRDRVYDPDPDLY